jgi:hypothetical protein
MLTPSIAGTTVPATDHEAKNELKSIPATSRARLLDGHEREAKIKTARAALVMAFRSLKAERIGALLALRIVPTRIGDVPALPSGSIRIAVPFSANPSTMEVLLSWGNQLEWHRREAQRLRENWSPLIHRRHGWDDNY